MSESEMIEILKEQNERLLSILEKFAEKDINIHTIVNSYNGSASQSSLNATEEHKEKINNYHDTANNFNVKQ